MVETIHTKPKKSKSQVIKRVVPPLQLDPMGRPIFPLVIGDLTLHSLGEVRVDSRNTICYTESVKGKNSKIIHKVLIYLIANGQWHFDLLYVIYEKN